MKRLNDLHGEWFRQLSDDELAKTKKLEGDIIITNKKTRLVIQHYKMNEDIIPNIWNDLNDFGKEQFVDNYVELLKNTKLFKDNLISITVK